MMATSVKLDDDLETRVQALGRIKKRSNDWIMREAITQYVAREEARESFKNEALAALEEFQETGMHLTLAEVSVWLETWGTDNETAPPECHS